MVKIPAANIFPPNMLAMAPVITETRERLSLPVRTGNSGGRTRLQRLEREIKEVTTLYNVAVAVGSSLNVDEVVWRLYKESGRLIDTTNFALALYDGLSDTLDFVLVFERGRQLKPFSLRRSEQQGLIDRVLATQAPLLVGDLLEAAQPGHVDPGSQAAPDSPERLGRRIAGGFDPDSPIRAWLGSPILNPVLSHEDTQGLMVVWSDRPNAFGDHELWLLAAIGTQAAIAIRNARLYESVLAERDRVIEAQEQARKALARDLHDGPTQLVSALLMRLDYCKTLLKKEPAKLPREIIAMRELARQTVETIRTLLFELRPLPLETQGLTAALHVFLERRQKEVSGMTRLTLTLRPAGPGEGIARQEKRTETALFAIVQETVNNALKHARARQIAVELDETATDIYVIISDDGNGFDIDQVMSHYDQQGSLGLLNIQERAGLIGGRLTLESAPGRGTRVTVSVPKAEAQWLRKRGATRSLQMRPESEKF